MPCADVIPLVLGWRSSPRRVSLENAGEEPIDVPVTAVLARSPLGWVLLDCGPPAPDDALVEALGAHGLEPGDVAAVAVSHLHADRAGGLGHFVHGPPIFVQRSELIFALGRASAREGYWRPAYDRPGLRWRGLRGDGAVAPGVHAIATPGHSPGHMSYLVRTASGPPWLFAMDAIRLREGVEHDVPIGYSADPVDAPLRRRSHNRLLAVAHAEGARLVPGRCPSTWLELTG